MAARTEEGRAELLRLWDAQEEELTHIRNIGNFLTDDVLEITREQYLSEGKWVTKLYVLVTGTGGPHVEFNTNHLISVFWAGDSWEAMTYDKRAMETIDTIGEYLDEIYGTESG